MRAILLAMLLSCTSFFAHAVEVTATGYGSSNNDALQNAKVLATEYVASTFITGKQELIDGKYKETLGQYNGGLVKKYKVTETAINNGLFEVTIIADVNSDKINEIIANHDTATNTVIPQIEQALNDTQKIKAAWVAISAASEPFVFAVDDVNYKIESDDILAEYHLHMKWNPKWMDDSIQLAKAINHPVDETTQEAVCWHQKTQNNFVCSDVGVLPMEQLYSRVTFDATLHYSDGSTELLKHDQAFATARPGLYDYNKWLQIPARDETKNCGGPFAIGLVKLFVALIDNKCFTNYSVESVIMYPDNISKFDFTYRTSVAKFKTIAAVTFSPEW